MGPSTFLNISKSMGKLSKVYGDFRLHQCIGEASSNCMNHFRLQCLQYSQFLRTFSSIVSRPKADYVSTSVKPFEDSIQQPTDNMANNQIITPISRSWSPLKRNITGSGLPEWRRRGNSNPQPSTSTSKQTTIPSSPGRGRKCYQPTGRDYTPVDGQAPIIVPVSKPDISKLRRRDVSATEKQQFPIVPADEGHNDSNVQAIEEEKADKTSGMKSNVQAKDEQRKSTSSTSETSVSSDWAENLKLTARLRKNDDRPKQQRRVSLDWAVNLDLIANIWNNDDEPNPRGRRQRGGRQRRARNARNPATGPQHNRAQQPPSQQQSRRQRRRQWAKMTDKEKLDYRIKQYEEWNKKPLIIIRGSEVISCTMSDPRLPARGMFGFTPPHPSTLPMPSFYTPPAKVKDTNSHINNSSSSMPSDNESLPRCEANSFTPESSGHSTTSSDDETAVIADTATIRRQILLEIKDDNETDDWIQRTLREFPAVKSRRMNPRQEWEPFLSRVMELKYGANHHIDSRLEAMAT